jgi:hypothetical protein
MLQTKEMTRIAFAAAILVCVFWAFSQILYLELVTTTLILYGLNFSKRDTFLIALIFSSVLMIMYGIQSFTIMYMVVFPIFGLLTALLKKPLNKFLYFTAFYGGLFSFVLGSLVDLPYLLFSGKATWIYLINGLQVGVPKGFATVVVIVLAFEPLNNILKKILKGY